MVDIPVIPAQALGIRLLAPVMAVDIMVMLLVIMLVGTMVVLVLDGAMIGNTITIIALVGGEQESISLNSYLLQNSVWVTGNVQPSTNRKTLTRRQHQQKTKPLTTLCTTAVDLITIRIVTFPMDTAI
jgi:hypothetical protein